MVTDKRNNQPINHRWKEEKSLFTVVKRLASSLMPLSTATNQIKSVEFPILMGFLTWTGYFNRFLTTTRTLICKFN